MRDITDNRNNVYELQRYLRELYHDTNGEIPLVNPDGIYGDETRQAVEAFQSLFGLPVTGEADNTTWNAIYSEYTKAVTRRSRPNGIYPFPDERGYTVTQGENSDISAIIQFMLRLLADTYDGIEGRPPEGVFNESTAADIREFQRIHGLPITGNVDKTTWDALAEAYNRAARVQN